MQKEKFPTGCRTILHVFQVFFSQGDNLKISLLQKVEEMAPFACKKRVKALGKHPRRNFHLTEIDDGQHDGCFLAFIVRNSLTLKTLGR